MKTTKILLKKTRINDWTSSKKWKENDTVKEWKAKWKTKRLTKRDFKNFSIKKGVLQPKHRLWLEMITNIYFRISNGIIKTMPIKFENLEKWTDRKIRWDVQVFIMNSHKPGLFFLINSWAKSEPEGHSLPSQNVPHPHKLYPDSTICQFTLGYLLRHKEKKKSLNWVIATSTVCSWWEADSLPSCSSSAFFCGRGLRVSNLGVLGSQGHE